MDVEIEQEDVDAIDMLNAGPLADNPLEHYPGEIQGYTAMKPPSTT